MSRFGLALAAFVCVLLSLEAATRLFWDDPYEHRLANEPGRVVLKSVDAPNLSGQFHGTVFRTNGLGFRGPDYAGEAAPGVRRIAVAGDSFVMGWGVEERDAYAAQLERRLNAASDGHRYEVINTGLLDINIGGAMQRLARAVDAYGPSVVVYGATLNDIAGAAYRTPYPRLRALALALRYRAYEDSPSRLLRFAWPRWVALSEQWSPSLDYAAALRSNYFANPAAWTEYTSGLDAFASLVARAGCGLVLVHTNLNQLDDTHPFLDIYARIEEAAASRALPVVQTFPLHEGRRPLDLKLGVADGHPNAAGHALLAEALETGIEALPESCWKRRGAATPRLPETGAQASPPLEAQQ